MGFAIIPFGRSFSQGGHTYHLSLLDPGNGMGMLYPMAIGAVAVYGILTAAWSSNNKWAILGGMRSSAQMVSYEIAMSLAVVAVFMRTGGYDPQQIIAAQAGMWNVLPQVLGLPGVLRLHVRRDQPPAVRLRRGRERDRGRASTPSTAP